MSHSLLTWVDGITWWMRFDAATVEEFSRSADVTTYPVETGAVLSDHYQPLPRRISLQGVVSNTPSGPNWTNLDASLETREAAPQPQMVDGSIDVKVSKEDRRLGPAGIVRPVVTGPLPSRRLVRANIERARLHVASKVKVVKAQGVVNRVQTFMLTVDHLMERKIPVSLILFDGVEFQDMMITDHRAPRRAGNSGSIPFQLELQQVIVADPKESEPAAATRSQPEYKPREDKGTQGTRAPSKKDRARADNMNFTFPDF